jgi:hypothetical protein
VKCFACGRKVGKNPHIAVTSDVAQTVAVGNECYKKIGPDGWQPPLGGPKLYRGVFASDGRLVEVIGLPAVKIPAYLVAR